MIKLIKVSLILALFFSAKILADPGDRQITLTGSSLSQNELKLSIKELESKFSLFSTQLYNPWDKKNARYTGILINDLANTFSKANVVTIKFSAIDDYQVTIPKKLWQKQRILLVTKENGKHIEISNKGPMRIVFPDYDISNPEYQSNLTLWMWMINRIEFD